MNEPSTKPLVTALMLAMGRAAELYDQCRKDGQTDTAAFGLATRAHYLLSNIIDECEDVPEDARPILAAFNVVIAGCQGWASEMDEVIEPNAFREALAVLGVTE